MPTAEHAQIKKSLRGSLRTGIFALITIISCPCHIPILLAVLSGTSLGLLLAAHTVLALILFSLVFGASLAMLLRRLRMARRAE